MPKVQSYRKSAGSGALQPVRAGTDMSLASQEAVMRSGLPDGTAARAQRDMSMAGVQRGRQAAELMAAGAKLSKMGGDETARVAYMSGRAERLALQSSAQILTAMGARFVKMQEDHDAAEVMEAANEWHEYVNQYFNDPEKGMKATRQLANAKGLYDDTSKYLEVVTERCAQNLRTPQQKQAFLKSVAGSRLSAEEKASVYEAQEMGKYAKQTTQQTVQSAIASVAEDPTPTNFNANFERARDAVLFYMRGADEESQRIAVEGLRSDFHAGIITNRMQTDPITAEKYFEQVKGEILPEARVKLEQDVRNAALEVKARAEAEVLLSQYGEDGMTEALAAVREAHAGPEAEDYAKYVKSVFSEAKTAREERRAAIAEGFYGVLNGGGSFAAAQRFIDQNRGTLGEKNYHSYMDLAERLWEVGDYAPKPEDRVLTREEMVAAQNLYNEAKEYAMSEAHPTPEQIEERYGAALEAATGSNKAFKDIIELTSPKAGGVRDKRDLYSADKIVNQLAKDSGVTRDLDEYMSFNDEWRKACKAKADEKGSPLTQREAVEAGKELLEDKAILGRTAWYTRASGGLISTDPLKVPEYQLRRLGISAEDVKWDAAGGEYVIERDGQFYALDEDEDFYELKPLEGNKRNFKERD